MTRNKPKTPVAARVLGALVALLLGSLVPAASSAAFEVTDFGLSITDLSGARDVQAGARSNVTTRIDYATRTDSQGIPAADGNVRDILVDAPPGLVGTAAAFPRCSDNDLAGPSGAVSTCSADTQIGTIEIAFATFGGLPILKMPLYNLQPPYGAGARFAANFVGVQILIDGKLRRDGVYTLGTDTRGISQSIPITALRITFWGDPGDPDNDDERLCEGQFGGPEGICPGGIQAPLMSSPTNCAAGARPALLRTASWADPDTVLTRSSDVDVNGEPLAFQGCDALPFDPSISVEPTNRRPDSPTGLDVRLDLPQADDPDELATAHLRDAKVTLPEGMTVSPSSANGLGSCSPQQIDLESLAAPTCPDSSKIGDVRLTTPLLRDELSGGVYLAKQGDNPFGSLLALYMVVADERHGAMLKLPGRVDPDPVTGRLAVTFPDAPELPFDSLRMSLFDGPLAPLATPAACGEKTVEAEFASYAGHRVARTDTFTIDCPGVSGFEPAFEAGSASAAGGAFSPFGVQIDRPDGQQLLDGVTVELPTGLLARLRGVPLCPDAQAAAGTCGAESRVGSATVGAGPGAQPFYLRGQPVYLAGPYKGAPYSLSTVARAIAGPLDLGTVVVRQALHVDPTDAHITAVSDPLPRILEGVPLRLRSVDLDVDRPGFSVNPTSCAAKQIAATLTSVDGVVARRASRFQATGCRALGFKPRMALRLTGAKQRRTGDHPGLRVRLRQPAGQANLAKVAVRLPRTLALDPGNAQGLCSYEESLEDDPKCPRSSIVGRATAHTPLLDRPLTGPVYFAENKQRTRQGNLVSKLPKLVMPLRGQIAITLRQISSVRNGQLVSTTETVPDAPVSRFDLRLRGGKGGIITVTRDAKRRFDLCDGSQVAKVFTDGQNGRRHDFAAGMKTPCAKKGAKRKGGR